MNVTVLGVNHAFCSSFALFLGGCLCFAANLLYSMFWQFSVIGYNFMCGCCQSCKLSGKGAPRFIECQVRLSALVLITPMGETDTFLVYGMLQFILKLGSPKFSMKI